MDILLAHGWFLADDPHERAVMKPYPPLGLLYISAYLKQQGYGVGVFDSTFSTLDDFRARLEADRPAVVGLYVTLMTKPQVLHMMRLAKAAGAWVVLGGPEPPHYAAEYLARGADVVVIGEGEHTLDELLPILTSGGAREALRAVRGLAFLDDGGAVYCTEPRPYISDLDSLPPPDRAAIDIPAYLDAWRTHHGASSLNLIGARGCPYTCTWCSHSVFGESHRRHSPARLADEVAALVADYDPDQLWYVDDVFTINHRWLRQYADELKKRGLRVPFECISRADRLDDSIIDLLAEMGCQRLWIGAESGSQRMLNAMRRKADALDVQAKTHALQQRGIETGMFIMLGYDGETQADLSATVAHLKAANPDIFLTTVAYPIKGTAYYESVKERIIAPDAWEHITDRDLQVAGRHSRRYYGFATRWMVNSVRLHQLQTQPAQDWKHVPRWAKAAAHAALGRVGMVLTQAESEGPPAGRGWYDAQR